MDQTVKTFTPEWADARKWIGRIIMAVILGEAIWSLIVSVMNNLVVPWLGDVMGQSSGLPTSFTQRPYDYPDLFVSVIEFCFAGIVAVLLNYFFQRQTAGEVKAVKSSAPTAPVELARVVPQAKASAATAQATLPVVPSAPGARPESFAPAAPVTLAPAAPAPLIALRPAARSVAVAPSAPPVAKSVAAKPLPSQPKAEAAKPKKPKEVYYNIVGEPVPSDED
jgi:large-conductance mechanosensitive channel